MGKNVEMERMNKALAGVAELSETMKKMDLELSRRLDAMLETVSGMVVSVGRHVDELEARIKALEERP